MKASQGQAERLEKLEEENERLRLAERVDSEPPLAGSTFRSATITMAAALALLVGAGGTGGLMYLSSGDETKQLSAELEQARADWLVSLASSEERMAEIQAELERTKTERSAIEVASQDEIKIQSELEQTRLQLAAERSIIDGMRQQAAAPAPDQADPDGRQPFDPFRDCEEDVCPMMVVIPAGTFMMGSPEDEAERSDDEGPQHEVTITEPFALCETEVTFDQWDACVADGGCDHEPDDAGWGRGDRPVIDVSWSDAQQYLGWLSAKTGKTYRLPSEAEWEYAARAGTTMPFSTGETITTDDANYDGNFPYAGGEKGEFRGKTLPVGSLTPNPFGLFDMHGNVWEWVEDRYHGSYQGAPVDGTPWLSGDSALRVLRGGSWFNYARHVRAANRVAFDPGFRNDNVGFRCARVQS